MWAVSFADLANLRPLATEMSCTGRVQLGGAAGPPRLGAAWNVRPKWCIGNAAKHAQCPA
eukprot:12668629-Alexandrium_andersonii.AAC.1